MSDPLFFVPSRRLTAADIATFTGADLRTPELADNVVTSLASADDGGKGAMIFVEGKRNAGRLGSIEASVLICKEDVASAAGEGMAVLVSRRPYRDFAAAGRMLFSSAARPAPITGETGVSGAAHIHPDAVIEAGAIVEAGAVIGPKAAIGSGTVIAPNAVIGPSCQIGRDCYVGPGVSILHALIGNRVIIHAGARIGQDGFGYVPGPSGSEKVPQVGRVVIQDDVEIGANTTVDRGALSDTVIGEMSKIDNLVQIAHNVRMGRACIVAGHCGISGSVTLGDGAILGGGVGVGDHISIGAGALVAGGSGVISDVPAGSRWWGFPAQHMKDAMREVSILRAVAKREREQKGRRDG